MLKQAVTLHPREACRAERDAIAMKLADAAPLEATAARIDISGEVGDSLLAMVDKFPDRNGKLDYDPATLGLKAAALALLRLEEK